VPNETGTKKGGKRKKEASARGRSNLSLVKVSFAERKVLGGEKRKK